MITGIIKTDDSPLINCPLPWQTARRQEAAAGYGRKLATIYKIKYKNRLRRVYYFQFSTSGTFYILDGKNWVIVD